MHTVFPSQFWLRWRRFSPVVSVGKRLPALVVSVFLFLLVGVGVIPSASAMPLVAPPVLAETGSLFAFSGERPPNLGVEDGRLAPCPTSPNCVSSQSLDGPHRIAPLRYQGTPEEAMQRLVAIVEKLPRTKVIEATDNYLYVEFTSALMGFVDDVEFYIAPEGGGIQVRSASRLGESDLGVNRKRIEEIRKRLNGITLAG